MTAQMPKRKAPRPPARRLAQLATTTLLLAVGAMPTLPGSASEPGVPGSLHQAYTAGRLNGDQVVPSVEIADYQGEHVVLQAVYVGRDAGEPTLGVDKKGNAFFAAAAYDGVGGLPRTKVLRSTDGGVTWTWVGPKLTDDHPSPPATNDPYVYVDEETGRVFNVELSLSLACSTLHYSDDQGATWIPNHLGCGQPVNDHQTIVAANPPAPFTTVGYPNIVYYCFNRVTDASCSRSLDGGLTFHPTGAPSFPGYEAGDPYNKFGVPGLCGGLHGHVVTDAKGRLYIPKSHCGIPVLAVSEDAGTTWRRTVISKSFRTGDSHVAEHQAIATDDAGNLYYLFMDDVHHKMWLTISRDAAKTFSEPMMVAPPGVAETNFPTIVAGAAGRIAMTFPGTNVDNRSNARRPWNSYVVVSTNALDATPVFVSATANDPLDPVHRGACNGRCAGMLDFLDVIVSPVDGYAWATAVDTCTAGNGCTKLTGTPGPANDAEGLAVRQIAGPKLRG